METIGVKSGIGRVYSPTKTSTEHFSLAIVMLQVPDLLKVITKLLPSQVVAWGVGEMESGEGGQGLVCIVKFLVVIIDGQL